MRMDVILEVCSSAHARSIISRRFIMCAACGAQKCMFFARAFSASRALLRRERAPGGRYRRTFLGAIWGRSFQRARLPRSPKTASCRLLAFKFFFNTIFWPLWRISEKTVLADTKSHVTREYELLCACKHIEGHSYLELRRNSFHR